jgi:hypothetical protein
MTGSTTTWPAAVSERSAALVHGAPRRATVLAAFPTALYLQVGGHADVLPVVTRDGLRLPTALAVATDLPTEGWSAQPGDEVRVGDGAVRLPGVTIRAVRSWRPHTVPRATASLCAGPLAGLSLAWRSPARAVGEALLGRGRSAYSLADLVGTLVGAGPGLTPSGDDVLCGALLALRLHPRGSEHLVADLWRAVQPRLTTTTSLSAALLREAADGCAAEPVVRLLEQLASLETPGDDPTSAGDAVRAVLAIGHTSGADLLGGLAGCLDALAAPDLVPASAAAPVPVSAATPVPASTAPLFLAPTATPATPVPAIPRSLP